MAANDVKDVKSGVKSLDVSGVESSIDLRFRWFSMFTEISVRNAVPTSVVLSQMNNSMGLQAILEREIDHYVQTQLNPAEQKKLQTDLEKWIQADDAETVRKTSKLIWELDSATLSAWCQEKKFTNRILKLMANEFKMETDLTEPKFILELQQKMRQQYRSTFSYVGVTGFAGPVGATGATFSVMRVGGGGATGSYC